MSSRGMKRKDYFYLYFIKKLGPKASCSWGKGKYYKLFTYKGVIQNGIFAHKACPYMRIKSVILINF